ncbi:MAG: DUF1178 family protein [Rhizomicrobium sp.]
MIVYALQCSYGHGFEAWFSNSGAFEAQDAEGKLVCPVCETRCVTKALMAPAVTRGGSPASASQPVSQPVPPEERRSAPEEMRKMRQFMTGLRKYVEQNADYVGPKFPEEARKIHYGETEERPIYGEASLKEVKELIEEGVEIAPLPPDPSEAN